MYLRTVLRTSVATRAMFVLIPWLVSYSGGLVEWIDGGYWLSVTAQSNVLIAFIAPACAASAAWEGTRVRRSRILEGTPVRSPVRIALSAVLPVYVLGAASVVLALLLLLPGTPGAPDGNSVAILAVEAVVVAAHVAVGYVLGLRLPPFLAAPVALVTSFLWMAFPAALPTPWLRQLNGANLSECCALDQTLAPRALLAPSVVALGTVVAVLLWIWAQGRFQQLLLAPLAVGITLAVAVPIATPLGRSPAQARPASELRCEGRAPAVCLWPEQQASADRIGRWAAHADARLRTMGVPTAARITPHSSDPAQDEVLGFVASKALSHQTPTCAFSGEWPGSDAQGALEAWLRLTAGLDPNSVQVSNGLDDTHLAEQVRKLPLPAQKRWYARNEPTLHTCSKQPDLDPAHFASADQPGAS
ncbi:hypothetical protein HUT18_13620 [Streptomyces sp. NA04227]|uniref:DUF7224 domain-containing protein n=1 Tax=Streptomyces sp. NA04227 TaxID=2742136 RepID=UPI0015916555|nr:hypothetical protein [Streptomyces sp. NA04227]QKW07275.1 hypothetical protein HUT18_13620 [Streptomyces sp. NA04227]